MNGGGGGKTLWCYDGSPASRRGLELSVQLCGARSGWVISVWLSPVVLFGDTHAGLWDVEDRNRLEQSALDRAADVAREGSRILSTLGVTAEPITTTAAGSIWGTILDVANERDAALIVVGSRGLSSIRSLVLGSVSHGLANHSHRPLLIVPATAE
jgi:nucleotide-binding universal stress UspA family protein